MLITLFGDSIPKTDELIGLAFLHAMTLGVISWICIHLIMLILNYLSTLTSFCQIRLRDSYVDSTGLMKAVLRTSLHVLGSRNYTGSCRVNLFLFRWLLRGGIMLLMDESLRIIDERWCGCLL